MAQNDLKKSSAGELAALGEREAAFVAAYLDHGGLGQRAAVLAAQACGITDPAEARRAAGRWLANKQVRAAIDAQVRPFTPSREEVLRAMSDLADPDVGAIADCFREGPDGKRYFDWGTACANGAAKYVKKVVPTKNGDTIELYDKQKAQELLGRYHSLWDGDGGAVHVHLPNLRNLTDAQLAALASGRAVDDAEEIEAESYVVGEYRTPLESPENPRGEVGHGDGPENPRGGLPVA